MALSAAPDLIPPSALEWREKLYKEDSARCAPFPKMVSIPTGRFTMGALQERDVVEGGCLDSEKPAHEVYVPAFELSKYPITFAEYDYYCHATGTLMPDDQGWGREARPVINVSWHDAQHYCQWLSSLTGQIYRLPSEAEWEYANRAGATSAYPWGMELHDYHANYASKIGMTTPVWHYPANAWGLYDMNGNVWEWVQDSWHDNYFGAPMHSRAWESANNDQRVLRGGSWNDRPRYLRSAYRVQNFSSGRYMFDGFRVARSL